MTQTTKHTPGPWNFNGYSITDTTGNPILVAKYKGENYLENIRLIAAAPDLLAALEFLLSDLNSTIDCEARIIAMDAIKAAKGK